MSFHVLTLIGVSLVYEVDMLPYSDLEILWGGGFLLALTKGLELFGGVSIPWVEKILGSYIHVSKVVGGFEMSRDVCITII